MLLVVRRPSAECANELSRLLGSVTQRWTEVLSPVVFVTHKEADLLPTIRVHKMDGFARLMKDARVSTAIAQAHPGDTFKEFLKQHIENTSLQEADRLKRAIFDPALVFGHAILDNALDECLRLAYELEPKWFHQRVSNRKVQLSDLLARGVDNIMSAVVSEWIRQQERESVLAKFRLLLNCTQPKTADSLIEGFSFDETRIEELDALRHSVVHRSASRQVVYEDLDYLRLATNFAAGLLTEIGAEADAVELFSAMGIELPWKT